MTDKKQEHATTEPAPAKKKTQTISRPSDYVIDNGFKIAERISKETGEYTSYSRLIEMMLKILIQYEKHIDLRGCYDSEGIEKAITAGIARAAVAEFLARK